MRPYVNHVIMLMHTELLEMDNQPKEHGTPTPYVVWGFLHYDIVVPDSNPKLGVEPISCLFLDSPHQLFL